MSLKGNLQSVDLANVLQMLSINQKEGTLVLFDGDTRKSIYFSREGVSMLSRGRRGQDTLGRVLLRYGKISPEQLQEALRRQEEEGRRLGSVLQHIGAASAEDIENAIRTQIEEEIYNLFIWREASFEFIEGPPPPAMENLPTRVTFNVNSLIMEAQRRADEWNYIRGLVPSLDEIYQPTNSFAEANVEDPVFHLPFAMNVLQAVNAGTMDVSELIDHSYGGKFEVCKILALLLEQGAVEPVNLSDLQRMADEAMGRGEHRQAAKFYRRIVELGGATPQVNLSLGYALEALEEPEQASHFLKAAAETYADGMQPKYAFDAYLRVARSLPTDLNAIQRMIEIGCENDEVLSAHRHDLVETGRLLSDCLREIGKGTQSLKILHRLAQKNPEDMALRSQLANAFQSESMPQEAMAELEAMATVCASKKSYEEAIRYLKKVQNIDRNRPGVLKRIDTLGRARDRNKRLLLRAGLMVMGVVTVAAVGWGIYDWDQQTTARVQARSNDISERLSDGTNGMKEAYDALLAAITAAPAPKDLQGAPLATTVDALAKNMRILRDWAAKNGVAVRELKEKYGDELEADFESNRREKDHETIKQAQARIDSFTEELHEEAKARLSRATKKALEGLPSEALPELRGAEELLDVALKAMAASPSVLKDATAKLMGESLAAVKKDIATMEDYARQADKAQADADALWQEGKLDESRALLEQFLVTYFSPEMDRRIRLRVRVSVTPASAGIILVSGSDEGKSLTPVTPGVYDIDFHVSHGLNAKVQVKGYESASIVIPALAPRAYKREHLTDRLPLRRDVELRKVPVWSALLGPGGSETAPVATTDGKHVVVPDRGGLIHLVTVANGTVKTFDSESTSGFRAGAVVTADTAYFASKDGLILALSLPALEPRWRVAAVDHERSPGPVQSSPVLMGGTLIVAGTGGTVSGLDAATGARRWSATLPVPRGQGAIAPVTEVAGFAVVSCEDGKLYCIDPGTGQFVTVVPSKPGDDRDLRAPRGNPLAVGKNVILPLEGGDAGFTLVEMPGPGTTSTWYSRRWSLPNPSASPLHALLPGTNGKDVDVLLIYTDGSSLRFPILRQPADFSGAFRIVPTGESLVVAPAFSEGVLFVATTKALRAVVLKGSSTTPLWTWAMDESLLLTTPPVVVGDRILVGTTDGRLHALLKGE